MRYAYLVGIVIAAVILLLIWKLAARRKHANVQKCDYLDVLSYQVWKPGRNIKRELEKMMGGRLSYVEVYEALASLEEDGLVERKVRDGLIENPDNPDEKIQTKVHEFKLTSLAKFRKPDLRAGSNPSISSSTQKKSA